MECSSPEMPSVAAPLMQVVHAVEFSDHESRQESVEKDGLGSEVECGQAR